MIADASGKILGVSEKAGFLFDSFKGAQSPIFILDILIVAVLFYWAYLFLRETRAMRILYGLFLLLILMGIGNLLNLVLVNWILKYVMAMLVVAIPIVFQPELRNALERLGRTKLISDISNSKNGRDGLINEIVSAINILSREKTGALIVVQRQTGLREYIENGTTINAVVSKELLLSVFFPKSPLHDGAVIISGNTIVSARSVLPVSSSLSNPNLGTRHKAGVGITEVSDAVTIIVSEETGTVSMAVGGKLERRIPEERLRNRLSAYLRKT